MEWTGYIAAILIGISLGLTGSGGSILTMPVLVYLFRLEPALATTYSLFIVGSTSLAGAAGSYRRREISVATGLLFGISSVAAVLLTRHFLLPAIPATLFTSGSFTLSRDMAMMLLLSALMLAAAWSMIRGKAQGTDAPLPGKWLLLLYGAGTGLVTGLLGAGGGFLLIPALVNLLKMPMRTAAGTSLFIIALNSLAGFAGDVGHFELQWPLLLTLSALALVGMAVGTKVSQRVSTTGLRKGFGWFVLAMAVFIIFKELNT
ncbi:sulfite exporter TauE/SafE family protein [Chitinophaga caseinilytica]|uniref:sulfite exporter TauE/SafE family protein n=1 Tax=Chitinophaga caseinilytica TaxID=2267521 RepID=UPI003C2B9E1E